MIIVDDEYAGRELIEKYVTDYCSDFSIAGVFRDGDEAIEFLSENDVELVITDIKMPRVSGIELAKFINRVKPYINVIAVSAYSEFEYARELIRYGVLYYLLKFVDLDEFLEAMDIVRENILSKKNPGKYDLMQTEMFFYDLFENNFSSCEEAAENYFEIEKDVSFEDAYCMKMTVRFMNYDNFRENTWHYTDEMLKNAVLNIVKLLNPHIFIDAMFMRGNEISLVLYNRGEELSVNSPEIKRELEISFGLDAQIAEPEKIRLKDVVLGIYGENDDFEAPEEVDDFDPEGVDLPAVVQSAIKIIEENYHKPIIRSEIAERINVSVVYLSKAFKKHTGKTLMSYLFECRMKRAVELAKSGKTINEICDQTGYNDERGFRRAFKKYTGSSIREYKKQFSSNEK